MKINTRFNILGLLLLVALLLGCGSSDEVADARPTAPPRSNCYPGVVRNAVSNVDDLSSYTVHGWHYLERSEGAVRELYMEDVLGVTRENGRVMDTDMAITIHFDEFHRTDYVRTGGDAYVRHNETVWQPVDQGQWDINFDGVMGDSLDFYEALRSIAWKDAMGFSKISEQDQYCEATAVDIEGQQAWKFTFYNVPQSLFEYGIGGQLGIGGSAFSQERLISGWRFQSAEYSATVIGFDADTQLVGESVRIESGDGSGNSFFNTWETKWSNFNEPVTIRRPGQ